MLIVSPPIRTKIIFIILGLICIRPAYSSEILLRPLDTLPPGSTEFVSRIHTAYENLRKSLSEQPSAENLSGIQASLNEFRSEQTDQQKESIIEDIKLKIKNIKNKSQQFVDILTLFKKLRLSLSQKREALPDAGEIETTITLLHNIQENVKKMSQHSNSIIQNIGETILRDIRDLHALIKISQSVYRGNASLGQNLLQGSPEYEIAIETLSNLVGRIFVFDRKKNECVSTSTGMIIPFLGPNNAVQSNLILTCCHNMEADNTNPNLEFYFVRTEGLDLDTGLPHGKSAEEEVISYLQENWDPEKQNDNMVRKIQFFSAHKQPVSSQVEKQSSRYSTHQDVGYGELTGDFDLSSVNLVNVTLLENLPNMPQNYEYYAIGFPVFDYLKVDDNMKKGPLVISQSTSNEQDANGELILHNMENGITRHDASTARGMSGGPVLRVNPDGSIELMGVISAGAQNQNYMCGLF